MNKKRSGEYNIDSDKDIRVSGTQGGKIIGEKLGLFSLIIGIPLFAIGIFTLLYMVLVSGFPENWPIALYFFGPQSLAVIIGFFAIIAGYVMYKDEHAKL